MFRLTLQFSQYKLMSISLYLITFVLMLTAKGGFVGIQVENSEARQYLQLAQYCASCNRGVMPVLPFNTVPNIGIVLAYYWLHTGAVLFGNTGESLK